MRVRGPAYRCAGPASPVLLAHAGYDQFADVGQRVWARDHSPMTPTSASRPSVSAAGPGWRMSADLISRIHPSATGGIAPKPSHALTFAGTNFFPHQEPMIMSGLAAITSRPDTIRSLALLCRERPENTSSPPAISISSETQRIPE